MSALAKFQKTRSTSRSSTTSSENPSVTSRPFVRSESWGSLDDSRRVRPRLDSESSNVNPLSPRTNKRLKTYGNELCQKHQIPENTLDAFVDLGSPVQMLMDIKAQLLSLQQKGQRDEDAEYITSQAFRGVLQDRLTACLLSPNLTAYVTGLAEHVLSVIKDEPSTFKVPPGVYHDRELQLKLSTLVKDLLTSIRSQFKIKIASSEDKRLNIGELTRLLAPSVIEITSAHWGRVAFLERESVIENTIGRDVFLQRHSLKHFKAMNSGKHRKSDQATASLDESEDGNANNGDSGDNGGDENPPNPDNSDAPDAPDVPDVPDVDTSDQTSETPWTYKEGQFWNYVDDELANLRKLVRDESSSTSDADGRVTEFFTHCLKTDLKEYPGQTIRRADAVIPGWQSSLHEKLIW